MQYVVILCHSGVRCSEFEGFLKELLTFCKDVIEIIDLYSGDKVENNHRLKLSITSANSRSDDLKYIIRSKCKIIISTPTHFLDVV